MVMIKNKIIKYISALLLISAILFTGCSQEVGGSSGSGNNSTSVSDTEDGNGAGENSPGESTTPIDNGTQPVVQKNIIGISLKSLPAKSNYDISKNEVFDSTGLQVLLIYDDASSTLCENYDLWIYDNAANKISISDGFNFAQQPSGCLYIYVGYTDTAVSLQTFFSINLYESNNGSGSGGRLNVSKLPRKTIYAKGEKINLFGIEINCYKDGYWERFSKTYTIKIYNGVTGKYYTEASTLDAGQNTVEIIYTNEAGESLTASFSILVVEPANISNFGYTTGDGSVSIDGFTNMPAYNPEYDEELDAPYTTVCSEVSDFEYEFIEGSSTDIIITKIKPARYDVLTDVTIPSKINGYNVKKISITMFFKQNDSNEIVYNYDSGKYDVIPIRVLTIQEGVEGISHTNNITNSSIISSFCGHDLFYFRLPYLKKLYLPRGFSLNMLDKVYDVYSTNYDLYCEGLEELVLPSDLEIIDFSIRMTRLQQLIIPASVKKVTQSYAFSNNYKLTDVQFKGKTDIETYSIFARCSSLQEVTFTGDVNDDQFESWNNGRAPLKKLVFEGKGGMCYKSDTLEEVIMPYNNLSNCNFKGCTKLKKLTLVGDYTAGSCIINNSAFEGCSSLQSITLPSVRLSIGSRAFYGCSSLNSVTFPSSITNPPEYEWYEDIFIGSEAFFGTSITSILFKTGLRYKLAEKSLAGFTSVSFEEGCKVWTSTYEDTLFSSDCPITSLTIPSGAKVWIGLINMKNLRTLKVENGGSFFGAIDNCSNLQLNLGDSSVFSPVFVRNMNNWSQLEFRGEHICNQKTSNLYLIENCPNLSKVTFNNTSYFPPVTGKIFSDKVNCQIVFKGECYLGAYAFYNQTSLTFDASNATYLEIMRESFYNCKGLTKLQCTNAVLKFTAAYYAFEGCSNLESISCKSFQSNSESVVFFQGVFKDCEKLKTLSQTANSGSLKKNSETKMNFGPDCFRNCKALTSIPVFANNSQGDFLFGLGCFANCSSFLSFFNSKSLGQGLNDLHKAILFESVFTSTSGSTFTIDTAKAPESIKNLKIKNITIPRSLYTYIPVDFANGNTYLQTVTLDCDIEARAFKGCTSLTKVTLGDTTFHSVYGDSFEGCTSLQKIIVPAAYYQKYLNSPRWKNYKSLICTQ